VTTSTNVPSIEWLAQREAHAARMTSLAYLACAIAAALGIANALTAMVNVVDTQRCSVHYDMDPLPIIAHPLSPACFLSDDGESMACHAVLP